MRIARTFRFACIAALAAAFITLGLASPAAARRGYSRGQIQALQKKMQQAQQQQQGLSKVEAQRDQEMMSKYDLNGNGKIDGAEKPAWDKYWREVKLGNQPHPYSTITQAEVSKAANPSSKSSSKKN
jgi:hypothetical protein